jgi:hypothetical protein
MIPGAPVCIVCSWIARLINVAPHEHTTSGPMFARNWLPVAPTREAKSGKAALDTFHSQRRTLRLYAK